MQMAASAFDILIGSVSDNIGLRWVWTNQRCNRTVCIHRMQFKGLGAPQQAFCNANGVCIDRHIACRCRRCIYVCPACGRYKASQCAFQIWKSFCNQDRQLSSSTWSWRLFFCTKIFEFATAASRASWCQLTSFESDFSNPTSKTLVGLRPNPIFSTRIR